MYISYALTFSALWALSSGSSLSPRDLSGQATFYGGNVAGGACSFSTYTLPSGVFGTALSDSNWDNSGNCGACVAVTGPAGNTITAKIVDECPGCGTNHLDLFPDAFAKLADPSTGVIDVTWSYIDCPITSPLQLHNKDGVSQYWFSMQVVNANQAVKSLEVSTDGGSTWTMATRQTYNFFEISSGTGTTTVDVKVTAADGSVVVVNSVGISSGSSVTATSNFGTSGAVKAVEPAASTTSPAPTAEAAASTPVEVLTPTSTPVEADSTPAATTPAANPPADSPTAAAADTATTSSDSLTTTTTMYIKTTIYVPHATLTTSVYHTSSSSSSTSSSTSKSSSKSSTTISVPTTTITSSEVEETSTVTVYGACSTSSSVFPLEPVVTTTVYVTC